MSFQKSNILSQQEKEEFRALLNKEPYLVSRFALNLLRIIESDDENKTVKVSVRGTLPSSIDAEKIWSSCDKQLHTVKASPRDLVNIITYPGVTYVQKPSRYEPA